MKDYILILALLTGLIPGCKSTQLNTSSPDSSDKLIFSMSRTGCFGRCPTYQISLYENRLLYYEAIRYTEHDGKYCFKLTKNEFEELMTYIKNANLLDLGDQYPNNRPIPPDIPACIITYNQGGKTKKITEYGSGRPEALITLEKQIDENVKNRKLHSCDK